ncbi:hypothetical protein T35B1_05675, partial [Salinisphaera shabanensis T35B1]
SFKASGPDEQPTERSHLAEIMPQARHPVSGTCYADLWGQMAAQSSTLEPVQLQTDAPLSP